MVLNVASVSALAQAFLLTLQPGQRARSTTTWYAISSLWRSRSLDARIKYRKIAMTRSRQGA